MMSENTTTTPSLTQKKREVNKFPKLLGVLKKYEKNTYKCGDELMHYIRTFDCFEELRAILANPADKLLFLDVWFRPTLVGFEERVQLGVESGLDVNTKLKDDATMLHAVSQAGNDSIVTYLLQQGADVNAEDKAGNTPLLFASASGHETTVRLLLDHGAIAVTENNEGRSPLLKACEFGKEAVARLLLNFGANPAAKNMFGSSALIKSAECGHEPIVRLLLSLPRDTYPGININDKNMYGLTALMYAVQSGRRDVIQLLLDHGADRDVKDSQGKTAIEFAKAPDVKEFYRNYVPVTTAAVSPAAVKF